MIFRILGSFDSLGSYYKKFNIINNIVIDKNTIKNNIFTV